MENVKWHLKMVWSGLKSIAKLLVRIILVLTILVLVMNGIICVDKAYPLLLPTLVGITIIIMVAWVVGLFKEEISNNKENL